MKKEIKVVIGYQKFYFNDVEKAMKFADMAADACDDDVININIKYIREEKENVTDD